MIGDIEECSDQRLYLTFVFFETNKVNAICVEATNSVWSSLRSCCLALQTPVHCAEDRAYINSRAEHDLYQCETSDYD
jgi:hypothetical protein